MKSLLKSTLSLAYFFHLVHDYNTLLRKFLLTFGALQTNSFSSSCITTFTYESSECIYTCRDAMRCDVEIRFKQNATLSLNGIYCSQFGYNFMVSRVQYIFGWIHKRMNEWMTDDSRETQNEKREKRKEKK